MLRLITPSLRTFVYIDACDECVAAHRVKIPNSLQQIFEASPRIRIFIGRPCVRAENRKSSCWTSDQCVGSSDGYDHDRSNYGGHDRAIE